MANRRPVSAADQFDNTLTTQTTQKRSDAHRWHAGSEGGRSRIRKPRRGVLLLVCLVLLVMFLMLGVTFVLTAGNFRRSSEAYQRMLERPTTDLPERSGDLLDSVARDLVRGTNNLNSPFSDENLLEDLYGQPLLRGKIQNNPSLTSGSGSPAYYCPLDRNGKPVRSFLELAITPDADYGGLSELGVNDYAGLVLTFLSGELEGQSVRVVSSINTINTIDDVKISTPVLTVLAHSSSVPTGTEVPASLPVEGDVVLVNGRPFSGDGTGTRFDAAGAPRQLNESYDAVDLNNPWLAYSGDNGSGTPLARHSWGDASYDWVPGESGLSRPFGNAPSVDCDNDGEPDAIWIDAGLPLQMLPDGSYVKPLVAMLVRDLDGRVNLNAHGSQHQTSMITSTTQALGQGYGPAEIDPGYALINALDGDETVLLNTPTDNNGNFFQDEEGNPIFGFFDHRKQEGDADLSNDGGSLIVEGDYGEEQVQNFYDFGNPEAIVTPIDAEGKGLHAVNPATGGIVFQPTGNADFSYEHANTNYGLHVDTAFGGTSTTPYGPDDLEAVLRFSDADSDSLESKLLSDLHDIVVKMDANGNMTAGQTDFDHDQMQHLRELLTTDSWDLPTPSLNWPEELVPAAGSSFARPRQITDLFARKFQQKFEQENPGQKMPDATARRLAESLVVKFDLSSGQPIDAAGGAITLAGSTPAALKTARNKLVARQLIAPGLLRGTRMNVNRLFGDGVDHPTIDTDDDGVPDSGNNIVDEPGEVLLGETTHPGGAAFDYNGNGFAGLQNNALKDPDDRYARQHYAQQLYLLLMLLSDGLDTDAPNYSGSTGGVTGKEVLARRLAQFAVNAADYRDADSIMTPFEYDPNPFDVDGWTEEADGDLSTRPDSPTVNNHGVVWGTEAPALVMTETLALHDRRTRDVAKDKNLDPALQAAEDSEKSNWEANNPGETYEHTTTFVISEDTDSNHPQYADDNFDQYAVPQGSLFIELQRIAHHGFDAAGNFKGPQDLYDANGSLNLSKIVRRDPALFPGLTERSGEQDPVWRIAISYPHVGSGGNITAPPGQDAGYKSPDRWPLQSSSGSVNPSWDPSRTMQPYPFTMDPFATSPSDEDVQCERFVWFHNKRHLDDNETFSPPSDVYFNQNQSNTELKLEPGEYALIGPREVTPLGRGDLTELKLVASDQEIRLNVPGGVSATDTGGNTKKGRYGESLPRTTKVMICGAERPANWTVFDEVTTKSRSYVPLSVSEPLRTDYYPENQFDGPKDSNFFVQNPNLDENDIDQYWPMEDPQTIDANGQPLPVYHDLPFDRDTTKNYPMSKLDILEGTVQKYRTAFLQRLANPLLPYNPDPNAVPSGAVYDPALEINPYIAVDAMPIDLTVFNGDATGEVLNVNDPSVTPTLSPKLLARSRARGGVQETTGRGAGNGSTTYYVKKPLFPVAFDLKQDSRRPTDAEQQQGDVNATALNDNREFKNTDGVAGAAFAFPYELDETLGGRNSIFYATEVDGFGNPIDPSLVVTQNAFWREGPLVSGYELMMVPASAPGMLSGELGSNASGKNLTGGFPHLLNFQAQASSQPRLSRIFEYVHVPSHYADTHVVLLDAEVKDFPQFAPPFNSISTYREPGRVNINTVSQPSVWQGVMNGMPGEGSTHPGPDFSQIVSERGQETIGDKAGESKWPFRSPGVTYRIPKNDQTPDGSGGGLVDDEISENREPAQLLFLGENNPNIPVNNNNLDNAYYNNNDFLRYQPVNRMGNLLTNRSNVYGVWMTIGFFATDENGNIKLPGTAATLEAGRSSGTHQRHRAFYLIDRSIPVAYEQGHDHNTDDVFRVKRYIE